MVRKSHPTEWFAGQNTGFTRLEMPFREVEKVVVRGDFGCGLKAIPRPENGVFWPFVSN